MTGLQRLRELKGELDAVGLRLTRESKLHQEDAERLQDASDAMAEVVVNLVAEETSPTEVEENVDVPLVQTEMTAAQRLRDIRRSVDRLGCDLSFPTTPEERDLWYRVLSVSDQLCGVIFTAERQGTSGGGA